MRGRASRELEPIDARQAYPSPPSLRLAGAPSPTTLLRKAPTLAPALPTHTLACSPWADRLLTAPQIPGCSPVSAPCLSRACGGVCARPSHSLRAAPFHPVQANQARQACVAQQAKQPRKHCELITRSCNLSAAWGAFRKVSTAIYACV